MFAKADPVVPFQDIPMNSGEDKNPNLDRVSFDKACVKTIEAVTATLSKSFMPIVKVSGSIGTLLVILYFIRIRHIPLDSLDGLGSLAVAVALVTMLTAFGGVMTLAAPSVINAQFLTADKGILRQLFMTQGYAPIFRSLCKEPSRSSAQLSPYSFLACFFWSVAVCLVGIGVAMIWIPPNNFHAWAALPLLTGLAIARTMERASLHVSSLVVSNALNAASVRRGVFLQTLPIAGLLVVAALMFCITYSLLAIILANGSIGHSGWGERIVIAFVLVLPAILICIMNALALKLALDSKPDTYEPFTKSALISTFPFLVLFLVGGFVDSALDRVMAVVSVRLESDTKLVVKEQGCQLIRSAYFRAGTTPRTASSAPIAAAAGDKSRLSLQPEADGCVVSGATTLSRVGEFWLIEFLAPPATTNTDPVEPPKRIHLSIPKDQIQSWESIRATRSRS